MFLTEAKRGGAGGPVASAHRRLAAEQAYQKRSERLLQDENCFKVYTVSLLVVIIYQLSEIIYEYQEAVYCIFQRKLVYLLHYNSG